MKPTRVRLLANLSVALGLALATLTPALLATGAEAAATPGDRCRKDLAKGSRTYLSRVMTARMLCENRIIDGLIPAATDCIDGRGDDILDMKLTRAEYALTKVGRHCAGVNLTFLGFPGSCQDHTGIPFDTADFQRCMLDEGDILLSDVLDYYYPPFSGVRPGSSTAACLKGAPVDAAMSFLSTLRSREQCSLGQEYEVIDPGVLCREQILPYGPGTGSDRVDRNIANGYLDLLGAIPPACVDVQVDDLDYQSKCVDPTGSPFTIYDLKQCWFDLNFEKVLDAMALVFPTEPVCGDGAVGIGEECDLGSGNSDTKPNTCRTDCTNPHCHDGVVDTGEQCDDGNTVDFDCCSGECVNDICGDGVKSCTEQCDNGPNNSNSTPNACRTNCMNPKCGDGTTDSPTEECDDGNLVDEDLCSSLCMVEFCGDDIVQTKLGEVCDNGVDNSDTAPDACRKTGPNACLPAKCGDGVTDTGEDCDDGNSNNADSCPNSCAVCGNNVKGGTELCDGTDPGNCPAGDACAPGVCNACAHACPGVGELVLYAGIGANCDTNADCPVGNCDPSDGHCHTPTRLDSGWTGLAHNADINDATRTRGFLGNCEGHGPTCGECDVTGVDPSTRNCRCSNDTRTVCDTPFAKDTGCPACASGDQTGQSCGTDSDCGGVCGRRCSNTAAALCATNGDCPTGATCAASATTCKDKTVCTTNAECGGTCTDTATCDCYFGAPFPLASGGTPACIVNRFSANISGTANVDLGAGNITANLSTRVYSGLSTVSPCPTCGGTCSNDPATLCNRNEDCGTGNTCNLDPVPDDGVRGGVCIKGATPGLACDAMSRNSSFPAFSSNVPGENGGYYSLDCLPDVGTNISGSGLVIKLTQTTGTSELPFNLSCSAQTPDLLCPCLQCTGDPTVPCNSNAECASQVGSCSKSASARCTTNSECTAVSGGACSQSIHKCQLALFKDCATNADCASVDASPCKPSSCSVIGNSSAVDPLPNQCEDLNCTSAGDGTGTCTTGPDFLFCDGILKANGQGVLSCNTNTDCTPQVVKVDAGNCTHLDRQGCFVDPVSATGDPDPSTPIGASTFCVPPTSSQGINSVAGLPGPGRIVNQATAKTFCEADPAKQYIPGVGGCLAP